MSHRVHHSAIRVRDLEASLRFYRDGLGLAVLLDRWFEGDWPTLLGGPSRRLRSVMLGDPAHPDAGIVELVAFAGEAPGDPVEVVPAPPAPSREAPREAPFGFLLLSLFVEDLDAALERLAGVGAAVPAEAVRRIEVPGPEAPVPMATVRDPDGVLVELIGARRMP